MPEVRKCQQSPASVGFIFALTGIWFGLILYRREMTSFGSRLIFEERSDIGDVAIEVLNLSWGAREMDDGGTGHRKRITR